MPRTLRPLISQMFTFMFMFTLLFIREWGGGNGDADSRPDRSTGPISHGSGPKNIAIATRCDRDVALRTMDLPRNTAAVLQRRA
ncbi:uncharacterized protein N7443_009251 [Penicillium atrosanguineum]|uniref:uncharacterized protein n=1 Tax=Penicillium atrosanguineum TaxID=1132637 RepID=UPI002398817D|nr:uncharacterized protein N7443_009251 [Penicillium atrosanguineum]KAJ5293298.1 hypothetical protein N7443_009251 [Penicillium atrosanguineum]